jgi:hypothetical protein
MIDEDLLEERLEPFRKKKVSEKISLFMKKSFIKDVEYMDFVKFVFLNGYHYAKVKHEKINEFDEYLDGIFLSMYRERVRCRKTRTSKPRLDVLISNPEKEEQEISKCFAAGVNLYFDTAMKKLQQTVST